MREAGATVLACPHCQRDTPVYRTSYGSDGDPIDFSVCLWCDGLIEYDPSVSRPHDPFASPERVAELREEQRRKYLSRNQTSARARSATSQTPRSSLTGVSWGHGWI